MRYYLGKIKGLIVISTILFGIESLITSVILYLPGYLIDHYKEGKQTIYFLIIAYFFLFVCYLLICFISNRVADYRRIEFEKSIREDFFSAVMERNYTMFHQYDIGEYISMQSNNIAEMCQNYLSPFVSLFRSFLMIIIFGTALIIFTNIYITAVTIVCSLLAVFIPEITAKELSKRNNDYLKKVGLYTALIRDFFASYDILDREGTQKIKEVHSGYLSEVFEKNMFFRKLNSFTLVLNGGAAEFISVIVFFTVSLLLLRHADITIGMVSIAFMYSTKFIEPIFELNLNIGRIKSVKAIQKKLAEILDSPIKQEKYTLKSFQNISIVNIHKSFQNRSLILPDMEFKYGNKYLIVGDNGTGKTVLFKLLMNYYQKDTGSIFYDLVEIQDIDIDYLNGYIPQIPHIFTANYYDNVTLFGRYSDKNLPMYESFFPSHIILKIKTGDEIRNLSGGEKQIIALLRGLCSDKPLLLLDEPFSAMNKNTISFFMKNIHKLHCTMIIIAHNFENYHKYFDKIYSIHGNIA